MGGLKLRLPMQHHFDLLPPGNLHVNLPLPHQYHHQECPPSILPVTEALNRAQHREGLLKRLKLVDAKRVAGRCFVFWDLDFWSQVVPETKPHGSKFDCKARDSGCCSYI